MTCCCIFHSFVAACRSHNNGGDTIVESLNPAAVNGNYVLPVGSQTFTLTVSNCAGNSTCSSVVTVVNQVRTRLITDAFGFNPVSS